MDNTNQTIPTTSKDTDPRVNIASGEDGGDLKWVPIPTQLPDESSMSCEC